MEKTRLLPNRLLVTFFLTAIALGAWAYDFVENGIYYTLSGSNAIVSNNGSFNTYTGDIVIPETVTHDSTTYQVSSIGFQAFRNSSGLTSVKLPNTIIYLMNEAFSGCTSLTSIDIPESVSTIYNNVFTGCTGLTSISCHWTTARSTYTNNFDASTYSSATLYVPASALGSYQSTVPWSSFSTIRSAGGEEGDTFVHNGIYFIITGANTAAVTYKDTNYNSYSGQVDIPETVIYRGQTYTITQVGQRAFANCTNLTGVTIPGTVTSIDDYAFYDCSQLPGLDFPWGLTSIGYAAFYRCGLSSLALPQTLTTIGDWCFSECNNLKSVTIPSMVENVGMAAFQKCTSLEIVNLRSGVKVLGNQAFYQCTSLRSVSMPATLVYIGSYAFNGCSSLRTATLREGLERIGFLSFQSCSSLTSVNIPSSVSLIEDNPWTGCAKLQRFSVQSSNSHYRAENQVLFNMAMDTLIAYPNMLSTEYVIPAGVTTIGDYAFAYSDNLVNITIPEGVTHIGFRALEGSYINQLTIPASVATIGESALSGCINITEINVTAGNTNYSSHDGVLFNHDMTLLHTYPCAAPRKHYSVPSTVNTVGEFAFLSVSNLKSVYIPSSVITIESLAFESSKIERLVIDEGVQNIGQQAFAYCYQLQSAYIPSTVSQLNLQAFYGDYSLTQLACGGTTPPTAMSYALNYCEGATLYVPAGSKSSYQAAEGWRSFANIVEVQDLAQGTQFEVDSVLYTTLDANLSAAVKGTTVKTIYDPGLSPKVLHEGNLCTVTQIGANAMQNCTVMPAVEVPFTVSSINSYAFYNCSQLKDVKLHEGLQMINQFAFSHNDQLTQLAIPATVDSISGTFVNYCNGLTGINVDGNNSHYTDIAGVLYTKDKKRLVAAPGGHGTTLTVADGTQVIGSNAVRGYSNLQSVNLPKSLRVIEGSAFFENTSLETVTVPKGVTSIGSNAFGGCTSLKTADLPETLTELTYLAFNNTPNLLTLLVRATTPPTCTTRIDPRTYEIYLPFTDFHFTNCIPLVPRGSKEAYQAANVWKNFANIIDIEFPVEATRGDVNDDGAVDVADVTAIIAHILGQQSDSFNASVADVNYDDAIDVADVTAMISFILSGFWPDDIDMWYLIGYNVGDNSWASDPSAVGRSLIPLFPEGQFNNGKGKLTYTAYFNANDFFRLMHGPNNWDDAWGCNAQGEYGSGAGYDAINIPGQGGYYTITFNTATMEFSITPYTGSTPQTFNVVTMPGEHNYWSVELGEYDMSPINLFKENHEWIYRDFTVTGEDEMKFVANSQWDNNWGNTDFPWGIGQHSGDNIPVKKGTYDIYFNDITGQYNFIRK